MTRLGDKMMKSNQEWMQKSSLVRPEQGLADQVAFDLGAGTSSIATSLGILYATRSPALLGTIYGARQKADIYKEARDSGKTPEESSFISTAAGVIEGGVEGLGGEAWLRSISLNKVLTRALLKSGIEAAEEGLQQTGEELVTQLSGVRYSKFADTVQRIAYSATLGFVLGYPAGHITSALEQTSIRKELKSTGLNDAQVSAVMKNVTEKTLMDGTVQAEVEKHLDEEIVLTTMMVNEVMPEPLEIPGQEAVEEGVDVPTYEQWVADKKTTELLTEDKELKPEKTKFIDKIAMVDAKSGQVFSYKIGQDGIYNHGDIFVKHGMSDETVIPGFIDKEGEFVFQYPEEAYQKLVKFGNMDLPIFSKKESPKTPGLVYGEDIKESVKPESIAIQQFEERLAEIDDLKLRAELAREAKEELQPILDIVKRRIRTPLKGEPEFEEGKAVPSMFKNKNGIPLDQALQEINDMGMVQLESTTDLIEFLQNLEVNIEKHNKTIEAGKIQKLTKKETTDLRQRIKDVRKGIREGKKAGKEQAAEEIRSAKEVLDRRRSFLRGVQQQFNLTDADLKSISKRDIRLMNNYEFKKFLDDVEAKAADLAKRRQIKNEIMFQIADKELQKVDNLRQVMELPTLESMSVDELNEFNQALEEFQKGDEFLSVRKLETVDNTELAGIKTVREAKEILASKLGVPLESVSNIPVSEFDKLTYDTALARKNPFYKLLVDETTASMLDAEEKFLEMEREVDELTKKSRESRSRTLVEKMIPTDDLVFEWLDSPLKKEMDPEKDKGKRSKEEISNEMTDQEMALASYLQARFAQFRDYLIQHKVLERYQANYITHIRRGFLETWKENGLLNAFKEGLSSP
jgi:hypothetical protein